jgi:hypothetical protein
MKMPVIGDIVRFDGEATKVMNVHTISDKVHFELKGTDGVTGAVPRQSIEWNGKQFIVNPNKLGF